ncbi:MAG: hypothetical protein ACJ764_13020 [Solirubrobacteraceae bacterium]
MFKREPTRLRSWGSVVVLTLIACLAMGVGTASARHRPGCGSRCRQAGGVGSGPGQPPPLMALSHKRVHRHGRYVDVRLRCLQKRKACHGVLVMLAKSSKAPELSRVDLRVPAGKTWTLEIRLSRKGLAYARAHRRIRGYLTAIYHNQVDIFRITIVKAG